MHITLRYTITMNEKQCIQSNASTSYRSAGLEALYHTTDTGTAIA